MIQPNPDDSLDLSGTDIVIFAGCSTAGNMCNYSCCPKYDTNRDGSVTLHNCYSNGCTCCASSYNMPKSAEMAGAKVAIGWPVTQRGNNMNEWIDCFFELMNSINPKTDELYTAFEACKETNKSVKGLDVDTALIFGTDADFRLSD